MFRRCSAQAGRAPTRQASVKMLQSTFPYSDNVVIFPVTPSLGRPFQALPLDQELYMYSTVGRTRPKTQSPVKRGFEAQRTYVSVLTSVRSPPS